MLYMTTSDARPAPAEAPGMSLRAGGSPPLEVSLGIICGRAEVGPGAGFGRSRRKRDLINRRRAAVLEAALLIVHQGTENGQ